MGSMIHLSVGRLEIDWGKNAHFADHSQLFQPCDLAQVPYYYVDEDQPRKEGGGEYKHNLVTVMKDGLSKSLEQVMERIDLLGYTMNHARREFEYVSRRHDSDSNTFSFELLAKMLATDFVTSIPTGEGKYFGKHFRCDFFDPLTLERIVEDPENVRFDAAAGMEHFSVYTILRLVAQDPLARGLPVSWHFADVEDGGWARRNKFMRSVDQENRFLIVTEGSSDAKAIRHALNLLKPHVADFFDFVDMNEGYPFTGTGNLYNFTKGLIGISVQNNVIILYDNDAEGVSSFNRTVKLNVPDNMRILKLPDLAEFRDFETVGPSGAHRAGINGRAAAIECYLDVGPAATVRWNNYHKELGAYHGELVDKGDVMRAFLAQSEVNGDYDFSRIATVVDMIVSECTAMRESARLTDLETS